MEKISPLELTIAEAVARIRREELSPVALIRATLERIERVDPRLNAFTRVTAEEALATARTLEEDARSQKLPLFGVPIALKDLFDRRGVPTTAGSPLLRENVPAEDAGVTERLSRAGAVLVGKTALHEWALGVTNENPHFGPTRNPWNLEHIPGGSSGGSGAAVAAGLCLGALGSDTGGSIRIPSALCGITGLKPTYGRVSLRGVVPLSWSLDHAGPMAKTAEDVALLLQVLAGYDPADPASVDAPVEDHRAALNEGAEGLRVLVPEGDLFEDLDPEVEGRVQGAIAALGELGARIEGVAVEGVCEARAAGSVILLTDAAAYHAEDLKRAEAIGPDVRARLRMGERSSGPSYARARRTQARWRRALEALLPEGAVLATPTTPIPAPLIGELDGTEAAPILTRFTLPFNVAGLPAISVPCGFTRAGLPVGLQLVARPWGERTLLRLAHAYQGATGWHRRRPPLGGG